jgi:hypothetical protein
VTIVSTVIAAPAANTALSPLNVVPYALLQLRNATMRRKEMSDLSSFAYTPDSTGQDPIAGTYKLWLYALEQAEEDLKLHPLDPNSSHRWFLADDPYMMGSFAWLCAATGSDPKHLRKKHKHLLDRVLDPKFARRFQTFN